jgi:predicted nucleic acid-binding protein
MGALGAALARMAGQRVYFDTKVFIYFLDQGSLFDVVAPLLAACVEGRMTGCTGDAVVAETMVIPYRHNNPAKIAQFKAFFGLEGFLTVHAHTVQTFDLAAQFAGTQGMRMMDALHYATAIQSGCRFLVTNDAGIKSSEEIEVIYVKALQAV